MRLDDSYTELTQWDTGRRIILDDSETCDQVHFTNSSFGRTIDMKTYRILHDNLLVVNIPDELLRSPSPLTAYCYTLREDGESTKVTQEFPVRQRNKPYNYIYNPEDQTRIKKFDEFVDDTMAEMNNIKSDIEEATVKPPIIQNGTWWVWDFDTNEYVDTSLPSQGPQGDQGIQGEQGMQGEKGDSALINGVPVIAIKGGTNIELEQTGTDLIINNTQQILMDFPEYIVTNQTMDDLLTSLKDNNLPTGNIYLGGVTCSDLPEGLMQAELKIEAIKNSDDLSVYYFTITSTDVPPYSWTATGFYNFSGWQTRPTSEDIPTKVSELVDDVSMAKKDTDNDFSAAQTFNKPVTFNSAQTVNGTLTVNGDFVQNGEAYESHAEHLYTKKDLIKTRDGAVGGLGEGELTGIEAEKYDGMHNGRLAFDADGTARVGDVGDEQPLLTREEVANLVDGQVLVWDGTKLKAVSSDEYVKNTDYPTDTAAGVIKLASNTSSSGLMLDDAKYLEICYASNTLIDERTNTYCAIVPANLDYAVRSVLPLTANTLPETLIANTEYYLGESTNLAFTFPTMGKLGQYCFVKFDSGATATTLTVTGNYAGDIPIPITNKTYEIIATWNGSKWVCSYRGY